MEAISKRTYNALIKKDITTVENLVRWEPRVYHDYTKIMEISDCEANKWYAVHGILASCEYKFKNGKAYLSMRIDSLLPMGRSFYILTFSKVYNYDNYLSILRQKVVVTGKVLFNETFGYSMIEPDIIEWEQTFIPHIARVYSKIGGVSEKTFCNLIIEAVGEAKEPLEQEILANIMLPDYKTALYMVHFPRTVEDVIIGKRRLAFNDLLYFSSKLILSKEERHGGLPVPCANTTKLDTLLSSLPYRLTNDQQNAIKKISEKMVSKDTPMDMLLQGDVGSGKTMVAASAMSIAVGSGGQTVLMAPRSVLAVQHYTTMKSFFGEEEVVFLGGSLKKSERKAILKRIADGSAKYIIGTHACIAEGVQYKDLRLLVTDEEHLFGVDQKESISKKAKDGVHMLSMSATPIPRTMTSIVYAGRDVFSIREKPAGRLPIITTITSNRQEILQKIMTEVRNGHQCYIVCPSIEESETSGRISVEEMEKIYRKALSPNGIKMEVVTGRTDKKTAEEAMKRFSTKESMVLLSTTVIEVGVDVPNATLIVIEQADMYGLASLHQLRGRVGRGSAQSYCILQTEREDHKRLNVLAKTNDGFVIAEEDLKQRGGGNLIGKEQSGFNQYLNLAVRYPDDFKKVYQLAEWYISHGYGKDLFQLYEKGTPLPVEVTTKQKTKNKSIKGNEKT